MITIPSGGETLRVATAVPLGTTPCGSVIILHEWWGLNAHIQHIVQRWADAGFVAMAPDLYGGVVATDPKQAEQLMSALSPARAMVDVAAVIAAAKAHPRSNGKVAVSGFCLGGALTLRAAATLEGISAAIPFYGVPREVNYQGVSAAVMMHVAVRDQWVTPALGETVRSTLAGLGVSCTVHQYEADHAFFNETRPDVYQPAEAALAWQRSVAFAAAHLAS